MRGMVQAWVGRSERDEGESRAVARGSPDMGLWTRRYIECSCVGRWCGMGAVQRGGGWFGAGAESRKGLGALTLV